MKTSSERILNYEVSGSGPVVVLLHGYLSSLRYWDPLKTALEDNYTIATIDLLGFGNSPKPRASAYGYKEQIDWIERTLEHANLSGAHKVVVGHSMGSLIALRYASEHPEAVNRLILMNLPLFKNAHEARRELAGTNLFFRASLYWELHRLICPIMRTSPMKLLMRQVSPLEYKGMETYMFSSTGEARSRSLRNIIESQQGITDLALVTMPTTIVVGTRERHAYQENIKQAAADLPKLKVILAETGHHTLLEKPDIASGLF
jgi:pimeloyl-ACP methyl ester carboxylesterase